MGLFEFFDDLYSKTFNYSEASRVFVTFAAYFGTLILFIYAIRLFIELVRATRLYVISQLNWCRADLVKRYGKWAVVTGATDGIGQSIAKELAARGMSILVVGRNAEKLANTKTMLEAIPNVGEVETVQIDLSDSSIANFDRIRQQIDGDNRDIGILINNAGTFPDRFQRLNKFDMEHLVMLGNLNMLSPIHMTRMIMPGMVARGKGLVVNVSSIFGFITVPYMSIYSSTKTFLNAFTRQLQVEYGSHPIDIILLTPGPVQTKPFAAASTMTRPSPFSPASDDYARSAVNALNARCDQYCGTITHGILSYMNGFLESVGLLYALMRMNLFYHARNFELSPVPKRKRLGQQTSSNVA